MAGRIPDGTSGTAPAAAPDPLVKHGNGAADPRTVAPAANQPPSDTAIGGQTVRTEMKNRQQQQRMLDILDRVCVSGADYELNNILPLSDQAQTALDQSHNRFFQAMGVLDQAQSILNNNPTLTPEQRAQFEALLRQGYSMVHEALSAQSLAASNMADDRGSQATMVKFIRDAAIQTDIALLTYYMGGAGSFAGRAGFLQGLAKASPKLFPLVSGLLDTGVTNLPNLLAKIEDKLLEGKSPGTAFAEAFAEVGTDAWVGAAVLGLGNSVFALGAKGANAAIQYLEAGPLKNFFAALKGTMSPEEFQQFAGNFEKKFQKAYDAACEKYKTTEASLNRAIKTVQTANYKAMPTTVAGVRTAGCQEASFLQGQVQHSQELDRLLGDQVPGHDLVGNGNKLEERVRQALSSDVNIRAVGKSVSALPDLEQRLGPALANQQIPAIGPNGRTTVTVLQYLQKEGIYGLEGSTLEEVETALLNNPPSKGFADNLAAGVETELARQAHNAGALHHQLFDEMGLTGETNPEAFRNGVNANGGYNKFTFDRTKPQPITGKDMEECTLDVVHAWRDASRGYKPNPMTWDQMRAKIMGFVKDGLRNGQPEFSPLQQKYLLQAVDTLQQAEKLGRVHPNGTELTLSRLRSLWVYSGQKYWSGFGNRN